MVDIVTAVTRDHRVMVNVFRAFDPTRQDASVLVAELRTRFLAHLTAEEKCVYPVLARTGPQGAAHADTNIAVHRDLQEKLHAVERAIGSVDLEPAVEAFVDAVYDHVLDEERHVLTALSRSVSEAELASLGEAFEKYRNSELTRNGLHDPLGEVDNPPGEFTDEAKAEIHELLLRYLR